MLQHFFSCYTNCKHGWVPTVIQLCARKKMFNNYVIILLCNLISSIFARLINLWNPMLQLYWNQSWYFCWLSKPVVGASQSQIFFHCIIWFCMLNIITSYHGNAFCIIGPCMIPLTKGQLCAALMLSLLPAWTSYSRDARVAGPCITNVIATCRKNFSQWESSFLWKLRCHWLKFLRRVAKTLVIRGPGALRCHDPYVTLF